MTSRRPAALVTGAARRVGAGLAEELAGLGYDVALHHRSGVEEAQALAARLRATGAGCRLFAADLSAPDACTALVRDAAAAFGGLEVLVNNASHFAHDTLRSMTAEGYAAAVSSNLSAPLFLIQAFAAEAEARGTAGATVVNLLDQKVWRPNPDHFSYTVGKVALAHLTPALALALAPHVRVAGIAPGVTLPSGPQSEADYQAAAAATPSGVSSTVADLRRALRFILETPAFSGQVLTVDGGETLLGRLRDVAYDSSVAAAARKG